MGAMRLYLSSFKLGREPARLRELVGSHPRTAVIMNATDEFSADQQDERLVLEINALGELGLEAEGLDLRHYFDRPAELRQALGAYGLVWLRGGNAFVLRRAMQRSGFDAAIKQYVADDRLVYGGFSAGAVIAAPTLRGLELVDDPATLPDGYSGSPLWDGLSLIDYSIAPHYRSDHPESSLVENVVTYFEDNSMPYRALRDGEVIVVDRDATELLGSEA